MCICFAVCTKSVPRGFKSKTCRSLYSLFDIYSKRTRKSSSAWNSCGCPTLATHGTIERHMQTTKVPLPSLLMACRKLMKNAGATKIGSLEADVTFLADQNLLEKESPSDLSIYKGSKHRIKYWVVHYDIVLISEGRSFRFEARWPSEKALKPGQQQQILDAKLIGAASSFKPGTA